MKNVRKIFSFNVLLICAGLLALGLRLYLYWVGGHTIPVTTDEAQTVLQALDIRAGKWPLLFMAQPYMFPVEAYWMAPLVDLLPRTALGMRVLVLIEGFVFVGLSLMILRRMGGWREVWPGILLVLFPSVYLVMNQTAYSQPTYNSAFILALAAVWLVMRLDRVPQRKDFGLAVAGGFFATMAFSNAMTSIALIAPLILVAAWNSVGRGRWLRLPGYFLGGAVGLIPYLAALWKFPGAHGSVAATFGWSDAFGRLWVPAVARTLPVTFGWRACLFPDNSKQLDWGGWGYTVFPYIFIFLLVLAAGMALALLWRKFSEKRYLSLGAMEWALGATILSLILFALSRRADDCAYRYLAPVVVVFPFLMLGLYRALPRAGRLFTGGLVLVFVLYNIATSIRLPREWRHPDFARNIVAAPDLKPALAVLHEHGIGHAVASHWAAYRIGFEAGGTVVCSQPANERFPGWPVPYKAEVDASTNVAYVLTEKIRFLKPSVFERHMRTMGVEAEMTNAGDFCVYYNFRAPAFDRETRVAAERVRVAVDGNREQAARMMDGHIGTFWRSAKLQHDGLWVEFTFDQPLHLGHLILQYGNYAHDRAPALRIKLLTDAGWETLRGGLPVDLDKFVWLNGHPVYGYAQQTFTIGMPSVHALRLEVAEPNPHMCWTLAEAIFYEVKAPETP
ncbi:MAG: hypothetical protein KJ964_11140 [Verrucomicrobia bacterium]|nr:hypothetical protein [Verrucomicrobiota bacterium]MBU1735882.1 hypothetical protein [Verrucomicrobiota bacterium]MBU1855931.1 hypothetical protein [Verrucomicrobiota bacterium]